MGNDVCVFLGEALARYNFGPSHPFGPQRYTAFLHAFEARDLAAFVDIGRPAQAPPEQLRWFHSEAYVERVMRLSRTGAGYLDTGDTPAFPGIYEAAATVVGTVLQAVAVVRSGDYRSAFVPIAGMHHARRGSAAGFCTFNDCAIAIEALRRRHGVRRIAYVDIDAHHGDGVFYAFEDDRDLFVVDFHEEGRTLYPGSGFATETGRGPAAGTKLNVEMPAGATDEEFFAAWEAGEALVHEARPEFILFQCGADSLRGDDLGHLRFSEAAHEHAARRLCAVAEAHCHGQLVALGGGGYNLDNVARAWCAVIRALVEGDPARRAAADT